MWYDAGRDQPTARLGYDLGFTLCKLRLNYAGKYRKIPLNHLGVTHQCKRSLWWTLLNGLHADKERLQ